MDYSHIGREQVTKYLYKEKNASAGEEHTAPSSPSFSAPRCGRLYPRQNGGGMERAEYNPERLLQKLIRQPSAADAPSTPAGQPSGAQPVPARTPVRYMPPTGITVSLHEEFPAACKAYDAAAEYMKNLFLGASKNRLDLNDLNAVLLGILGSLERNPDALLSLPRLRLQNGYMYRHSVNVGILLAAFALYERKPRAQVALAALAGFLHDIGMALLPLSLLSSRKRLSNTERVLMMRHPMLSCGLLSQIEKIGHEIFLAALDHHENYDGSGYPNGKAGKEVSGIGLLTAVAGSYDALASKRPFRQALHPHKALGTMFHMREKQYHPEILERFVRMLGIYPVGSIVELRDGYRGVVSASFGHDPIHPVVILVMDPDGRPMPRHECDLARDGVAEIERCLSPESAGIDPCAALGVCRE